MAVVIESVNIFGSFQATNSLLNFNGLTPLRAGSNHKKTENGTLFAVIALIRPIRQHQEPGARST